jgi:tripartite-type tricarboxylate transporter receptor subunit TctC
MPQVQSELLALGIEARSSTPEEMKQRVQSEIAKWNVVIDKIGIERQK